MNIPKPTFIRTLGIVIAAFSGLIVFSNLMGLVVKMLMSGIEQPSEPPPFDDPLFRYFDTIAIIGLAMGLLLLGGGIYIAKYKNWARLLVIITSIVLILAAWVLMYFISVSAPEGIFKYWPFIVALGWSAPIVLLIWYLNKGNVKKHFN